MKAIANYVQKILTPASYSLCTYQRHWAFAYSSYRFRGIDAWWP